MKAILVSPHPVLTAQAKTVTSFDKRLVKLVNDMKTTLRGTKKPKGVGLAAPQIGEPWRVFVVRPHETIRVFINPEIVSSAGKTDGVPDRENKLEGCLSIPNIWGKVQRSETLTLRFQDETGTPHKEQFSGFLATIIQHETDHVNGVLFVQRVLEQKGTLYQSVIDKEGKEMLEEVSV